MPFSSAIFLYRYWPSAASCDIMQKSTSRKERVLWRIDPYRRAITAPNERKSARACLPFSWLSRAGAAGSVALPAVSRCAALNPLPGDFAGLGLPGYDELDAANFAPLCRAEVLLGTCLMDEYAPPKGQAAIYNRLTCPKQWKLYPKYVHERVNFFENQMLCFFKDGIPEA